MKIYYIVFFMLSAYFLCGCNNEDHTESHEESQTTMSAVYGYPDGEIQNTYLYVNGRLYVYTSNCKDIDEEQISFFYPDYEYIGSVGKISNTELPNEEFEASRTEPGAKVFKKDDAIILYSNGRVQEMKLSETQQ